MNQESQEINFEASPAVPVKRRRGRPRKDPSQKREVVRVPRRLEGANGNPPRQLPSANDFFTGQSVTGVVDAAFDAGYFLTVKIGNSNTVLRGVVFKPGHFIPVTSENDVAPHVQMIRRNEIHPEHRKRARPRERNEQQYISFLSNGSPASSQVHTPKARYTSLVVAQPAHPVGARGTVVPVVLQPVNLQNGPRPTTTTAAASREVPSGDFTPLAVCLPEPSLAITSQDLPSETPKVTPKEVQNEAQQELEVEDEQMKSSGEAPGAAGDGNKEVYVSPQSSETQVENSSAGCVSSAEDSHVTSEGGITNINQPFFLETLQPSHSDLHNQPAPIFKPFQNYQTGKMTELLQAMQENMMGNQAPQVEDLATGSGIEFYDLKNPTTEFGDQTRV